MKKVQLIDINGTLYTPFDAITDKLQRDWHTHDGKQEHPILIAEVGGGDHDTIPWPMKSQFRTKKELTQNLASALYDAREMGTIPSVSSVLLPDGTEFAID